ncbi:MAG: pyridoxine 5'-phosphate synthase [Bacteroidales bacterium]|nr:pyridoxine 5'-phosphate synthase [Bacteroidales bacterium]
MTKLSVNINKIATLRNARGGNVPDVLKAAVDCEAFGADGITVHPRPDERHIRYDDVVQLKPLITTEFNIEGNPEKRFMDLVLAVKPHQVTLVPDSHDALTSSAGWDTQTHFAFLSDIVETLRSQGIRSSIFVDSDITHIEFAAKIGADRIELYTEPYAANYAADRQAAIASFVKAATVAKSLGLGVNAGHDLSLENLTFFHEQIPWVEEVSIGHALIADALYLGLKKAIQSYKNCLK